MKKLKFNLQADMVMQIKAGEKEGIIDANGTIYLPVMAGFAGVGEEEIKEEKAEKVKEEKPAKKETPKAEEVKPEPKKETPKAEKPKKEKPAPEPEVVDDTVTEEKPEEKAEVEETDMFSGKEELSFEELDKGLPLWVYINAEGMNDKLWAAEVGRIEDDKIYVVFDEDGEEDFLRTGDRVFKKDLKF